MRPAVTVIALLSLLSGPAVLADTPARLEILRVENIYVSERGTGEARIAWKTGETVLYQVRRGYNCADGEILDKVALSGVADANIENILHIRAAYLKPGLNPLSICVNRAPLAAASSETLDYALNVYEKNFTLILDNTPPVTLLRATEKDDATGIALSCHDNGACENTQYTLAGNGRSESGESKNGSITLTLGKDKAWVEVIRYASTDRAGNREAEQEWRPAQKKAGIRIAFFPAAFFRADSRGGAFPPGWGAGVALDLPLFFKARYLPALRLEMQWSSFALNQNNEEDFTALAAGGIWRYHFARGQHALAAGGTAGVSRYFGIRDARQVAALYQAGVHAFAGYELMWRSFFFFAHWRLSQSGDATAHGPALAFGILF